MTTDSKLGIVSYLYSEGDIFSSNSVVRCPVFFFYIYEYIDEKKQFPYEILSIGISSWQIKYNH